MRMFLVVLLAVVFVGCSGDNGGVGPSPIAKDGQVTFTYERPANLECTMPRSIDCELNNTPSVQVPGLPLSYMFPGTRMVAQSENTWTITLTLPRGEWKVFVHDPWHVNPANGIGGHPWGMGISANGVRLPDHPSRTCFRYDPPSISVPASC